MFESSQQKGRGGRRTLRDVLGASLGSALLASLLAGTAAAQCVGDCDGSGDVAINELVTGVNIALGSGQLSSCPSFDVNGSGGVEIFELIAAVNNALSMCPSGGTPTATPSATPTTTPTVDNTPTATATVTEGCGDGFVDLEHGETCDDGNTEEGDDCPANCRIAACQPSATMLTALVAFDTTPENLFVSDLILFVRYPDGTISVPGSSNQPPVLERVTSDIFSVTPNDRDYGITAVLSDPSGFGYEAGTAMTIVFDVCEGATAPPVSAITCTVKDATEAMTFNTVTDQVTCRIAAP